MFIVFDIYYFAGIVQSDWP